jgi:hypothetical protein
MPADPHAARLSAVNPTIAPDFNENVIYASAYVTMFQGALNTEVERNRVNMEPFRGAEPVPHRGDEISMAGACRESSACFKLEFPPARLHVRASET